MDTSHSKNRRSAGRGPGRRPDTGDADSRHELLVAARHAFAQHGFRGTTIRHVATRAGVTPAMIHYHFGDKQGLYEAMLRETLEPLLAHLKSLAESDGTLEQAVRGYMQLLTRAPEIPALLMRDVLSADAAMRETFIREFATRAAAYMQGLLQREAANGALRDDVDPRLALLSLMSMTVFPFIARPVAGKILGLAYDENMIEQLAEHTTRVFRAGVMKKERDA